MEFIPAGEIVDNVQIRTVTISSDPNLPDGEYAFVDMYCTDDACDCRKTMVAVMHNGAQVATVDFGWETDAYYQKWMGGEAAGMPKMSGASIAMCSKANLREGVLILFNHLLNEQWIGKFKEHYRLVKAKRAGKQKENLTIVSAPKFTDQYQDLLQNIETAIIHVHRHIPLLDYDVMEALEYLIDTYKHISQGREPKAPRLNQKTGQLYTDIMEVCCWRMGTEAVSPELGELPENVTIYSAADIVACLKRILKSVKKWNKGYGRTGYLTFIGKFSGKG